MKYDRLIRPILFRLSPETAHEIGIGVLRFGLSTKVLQKLVAKNFESEVSWPLSRFGLQFKNPLGLAAGFDKNGAVVNQLAALGFGFVEVGTVTFRPQKGNEKPRLFRLPEDQALINRLGFNNDGAEVIAKRLKELKPACVVGVNIGRNKDVSNEAAVENYLATFDLVHDAADYIAINVSSPNTPELRELQREESLENLIGALMKRNTGQKPLLLKIAPDLTESEIEQIVDVCLRTRIAGIIATNTTVGREGLTSPEIKAIGAGGLSGKPLSRRSTEVVRQIYRYSKGALPIVGVGGIFTAEDAFEKIAAGASLIQAYTGFVYGGPSFPRDVNLGLHRILKERGFTRLDDAVGSANKS